MKVQVDFNCTFIFCSFQKFCIICQLLLNLTYVFYPKPSSSYSKAIFRWCYGSVKNVFFRISGDNTASYLYNNDGGTLGVTNCTFFHDLKSVDSNYSGYGNFTDIATNVNTNGTNSNVIIQDFGTADMELSEVIQNSEENEEFINNNVGVIL